MREKHFGDERICRDVLPQQIHNYYGRCDENNGIPSNSVDFILLRMEIAALRWLTVIFRLSSQWLDLLPDIKDIDKDLWAENNVDINNLIKAIQYVAV